MTAPISASLMPVAEISWREDLMSMPHCDTRSYPRQLELAALGAGDRRHSVGYPSCSMPSSKRPAAFFPSGSIARRIPFDSCKST